MPYKAFMMNIPTHVPTHGNFEDFLSHIQSPALRAVAKHWGAARGLTRMPSWADLLSDALLPYSKMLWSFAYDPKTGEFHGHTAGDKLNTWLNAKFTGGRLQDLARPPNIGQIEQRLAKLVITPLAGRSSGRLFAVGDFVVSGERIALPIAENGETGDGILGASDYVQPPLLGPRQLFHENVEWYEI